MSDESPRQQLRAFYHEQNPKPETLDHLLAATRAADRRRRQERRQRHWLLAAILLMAMAAAWLFGRDASTESQVRATGVEVAMNHTKNLSVEVQSAAYPAIGNALDKLGFEPVAPTRIASPDLELIGGRYCSIQGHLAAQLRLVDAAGRRVTLYQTPLVSELESLAGHTITIDGIRVELWQEQGLLMALAQ